MNEQKQYTGTICRGSIALGTGCGRCEKCRDEIKRMRQQITTNPSPKGIWYGLAMMVDDPRIISHDYTQMELADVVITQDEVLKNRIGYRGKIFGDHI